MKLRIHRSFLAAALTAVALLALLPASSQGQATKVIDPFNWLERYDSTQMMTLTGVISKVDWTNPHIWIELTAPGPDGQPTSYGIEGSAVTALKKMGWSSTTFRQGDKVTVSYHPMKDGTPALTTQMPCHRPISRPAAKVTSTVGTIPRL